MAAGRSAGCPGCRACKLRPRGTPGCWLRIPRNRVLGGSADDDADDGVDEDDVAVGVDGWRETGDGDGDPSDASQP